MRYIFVHEATQMHLNVRIFWSTSALVSLRAQKYIVNSAQTHLSFARCSSGGGDGTVMSLSTVQGSNRSSVTQNRERGDISARST